MANSGEQFGKSTENWGEKGSRWLRNFNLAVGGIALAGAVVITSPEASAALVAYGAFNIAQAGFFEVTRRLAGRKSAEKVGKTATANSAHNFKLAA